MRQSTTSIQEVEVDKGQEIKNEIEKLEYQIQKLGGVQSCGWDPADHKEFLRVKTKHKDRMKTVAFMNDMRGSVPTEDEDSIRQHIEVFEQVTEMIERKKQLMKEYKDQKNQTSI